MSPSSVLPMEGLRLKWGRNCFPVSHFKSTYCHLFETKPVPTTMTGYCSCLKNIFPCYLSFFFSEEKSHFRGSVTALSFPSHLWISLSLVSQKTAVWGFWWAWVMSKYRRLERGLEQCIRSSHFFLYPRRIVRSLQNSLLPESPDLQWCHLQPAKSRAGYF